MAAPKKRSRRPLVAAAVSIALLAGCATGKDPRDPFEPFNRAVYSFNETLDRAILEPVAKGYRAVLPQFLRSSVSNFFGHLGDIMVAVNNVLQGKFTRAYTDFGRIAINTTLGVGGLFDVASEAGIEKNVEDFGQTLGWWGAGDGAYLVLPLLGPSTTRDAVGRVGDYFTDPVNYVDPTRAANLLRGTRVVNLRAELLGASTVLQTAALDPYEFVRDAYLQRRRNLVYDGAPPIDRSEFSDPPPQPRSSAPRVAPTQTSSYATVLITSSGETVTTTTTDFSAPVALPRIAETVQAAQRVQH